MTVILFIVEMEKPMPNIQSIHQNHIQKAAVKKPEKVQKKSVKTTQMIESPESLRPEDIHAAQQELGNQVVQRALDRTTSHSSLTDEQGNLRQDINAQIQQKRGSGSQLPEKIQREASQKLGRKFTDVRIHTDESADKLSRAIHARAFTIGKDIFFKNGVFAPSSTAGRETIIHELTHVVQQGGKAGANSKLKLGAPGTAHEKEADQMGKKFASTMSAGAARSGTVQAQAEDEELQLQGEDEELQLQGEEEELQLQEDDEEIQPQPEVGSTVQRADGDDEDKDKIPEPPKMTPKMQLEAVSQEAEKLHPGPKKEPAEKKSVSLQDQIKSKAKSMKPGKGIQAIEKNRAEKVKQMQSFSDEPTKEGKLARVPSATEKRVSSRGNLMATIENPSSKPEDVKAAQEKLDLLHKRSKKDTFKSFFKKGGTTKSFAKQAQANRRNNLFKAAQGGDEEAFKNYKEEEAERKKNSTSTKIKGALGGLVSKAGGALKGALGGVASSQLSEYKEHFAGKSESSDEKEKPAKEEEKGGSGSSNAGAGMGAMMEKYGELVKENMKLNERVKELEAKQA
jgi:hypothetical protein